MKKDKKILLIDDEEQDRKSMRLALEKEGYKQIQSASTVREGVEAARAFKPDFIVLDVVLPNGNGRDGFDLCKQLKIEGLNARVVMITGHLDAINANKARISCADEIIEKVPGFTNIARTIEGLSGGK